MQRLFSTILIAVILSVGFPALLIAGGMHVSGDVSGIWPAGEVVNVDGPIYVLPGKTLVIEPGVRINLKTDATIIVQGSLRAEGTVDGPIVIEAMEGWQGFDFQSYASDIRILRFVRISHDAGTPRRVVVATNSLVDIEDCDFFAHESCLYFMGGRIWASRNSLLTTELFSKTVRVDTLANENEDACMPDSPGNRITENIIKAIVPFAVVETHSGRYTAGLVVEGSTNICLYGNAITVTAPGIACGAYFGEPVDVGNPAWTIDFCVVTVRGLGGVPRGIFNANYGGLNVIRCSVDVGGDSEHPGPYDPQGVLASGQAQVLVNSSWVQIDRGDYFYVGMSGGTLVVNYADQWRTQGSMGAPGLPDPGQEGQEDLSTESVTLGDHVYWEDPHLRLEGRWGAWQTLDEVQAYYGILPPSPCINSGDTIRAGWDPDHSLPDIGRYSYLDESSGIDPRPSSLPTSVTLASPYPNPFNATTVIPFTLNRNGYIRAVVYDLLGRQVTVLSSGLTSAGSHELRFSGEDLSSGMYVVTIQLDGVPVASKPAVLLK